MTYVQFSDEAQAVIITEFSEPQDPEFWPNQGEVEEGDARYLAWLSSRDPSSLVMAEAERDRLLSAAALQIAPLQDAVDLGTATNDQAALLKSWKIYRVAVSAVTKQAGYPTTIEWPVTPES